MSLRTFRCLKETVVRPIPNEYLTVDVEASQMQSHEMLYTLNSLSDSVYYCRKSNEVSCSYMRLSKFKACLRNQSIVFTD